MQPDVSGFIVYDVKNKTALTRRRRSPDSTRLQHSLVGVVALTTRDAAEEVLLIPLVFAHVLADDVAAHAEANGDELRVWIRALQKLHQPTELRRATCTKHGDTTLRDSLHQLIDHCHTTATNISS